MAGLVQGEAGESFHGEVLSPTTGPSSPPRGLARARKAHLEALSVRLQRHGHLPRVLLAVALVDRGSLVIPPPELRFLLAQGQHNSIGEQDQDVAHMSGILEGRPHPGARPSSQSGVVALAEEHEPTSAFLGDGASELGLRHGRRIKPALAASLLGDHLEPVPFVGDERMMVEEAKRENRLSGVVPGTAARAPSRSSAADRSSSAAAYSPSREEECSDEGEEREVDLGFPPSSRPMTCDTTCTAAPTPVPRRATDSPSARRVARTSTAPSPIWNAPMSWTKCWL